MTAAETVDLTALGQDFTDDPYPVYARLRERAPVHHVRTEAGDMWLVVGYEEGRAALADQRLSKDWHTVTGDEGAYALGTHMLETDPPRHTRLRRLIAREFTGRRVEALRPRVRQIADELLDAMVPAGRADLVASYAFPLPMTVICELLGVPDLDRAAFSDWTRRVLGENKGPEDETAAVGEMSAYLVELIEDKRAAGPREDLLSALIATREEDGDRLSPDELLGMAFLLLVAGHETTVSLIANGTLALLRHPRQLAALRADTDALLPGAIEEMLRYDGPLERSTYRFTREPYAIGEVVVPRGETMAVVLAAADRDPSRFREPDVFDVRRSAQGHLAFGHGIHYCLGAPLARLEGEIAFRALLARCPDLALDAPAPAFRLNPLMRAPHHLYVTF